MQALEAEGKEYDDSHFFFAGYDPPFRLTNRHNEIWAIAKGGAGSTSAEQ